MPTPEEPGRPSPRLVSIRLRLLLLVLTLVALSLAIAGLTAFALERSRVEQRVTATLQRDASEFVTVAGQGRDPGTGAPFTSAGALVRASMQYRVLSASEGELGILNGRVRWLAPEGVGVRLEADSVFVDAVLPMAAKATTTLDSLTTPNGRYRFLVIPVVADGSDERAALVRAFDLDVEYATINRTYVTFALVGLGALLLVGGVTWLVAGRLLEPVAWLRQAAEQIGEEDLSRRIPVRGHDDLTALTVTVNSMLDRLEAAVRDQRDLLDDVGHELRTPITIVRGHLELMDAADPDDVAGTRALAIDELDRMRLLVDDLLLLATAGRPDFVRPVPTDVGRLTDETLEKARGLGDRRWQLDELADVTLDLDPQRITQAWLQLAANAVQYSEPGTPVGLGSRAGADAVSLWVRDSGVGVDPADHDRIVRRFGRGTAPSRTHEGAGLGLAIVASIAHAHGGRLDVASTPGVGSTFTIVLPRSGGAHDPDPDPEEAP